jgi:Cu/Ag efflux protein CusF
MRPTTIIAAVVLAAALPPLLAQQQSGAGFGGTAAAAPGRAAGASTAQIIATVEAVDAPQRSVTLKGPKGNVQTMTVSEDVRNLAQVKVGDRVIVNYAQALALELRKGASGIRERIERAGVARAAMIGRPIGSVGRQVDVLADVVVVNYNRQTLTLRSPKQTVTLAVPDAAQLRSITTGDQVHAIYTEAFAVAVRAAPGTSGGE